jgi:hypothetical protein
MDNQVDVAATLRKIENRVNNKKPIVGLYALGIEMIDIAKAFLRNPNRDTWHVFARIEQRYIDLACSDRPLKPYSEELKRAMSKGGPLHGGGVAVIGNQINNAWNPAHRPARGFVYGFWTPERPKLVKIGSTAQHPQDRLVAFAKRYGLAKLRIVFFFEMTDPVEVEHRVHEALKVCRRKQDKHDSVEWFEVSPRTALDCVQSTINHSGCKRLELQYVAKNIDTLVPDVVSTAVPVHVAQGGRRITRDEVLHARAKIKLG